MTRGNFTLDLHIKYGGSDGSLKSSTLPHLLTAGRLESIKCDHLMYTRQKKKLIAFSLESSRGITTLRKKIMCLPPGNLFIYRYLVSDYFGTRLIIFDNNMNVMWVDNLCNALYMLYII